MARLKLTTWSSPSLAAANKPFLQFSCAATAPLWPQPKLSQAQPYGAVRRGIPIFAPTTWILNRCSTRRMILYHEIFKYGGIHEIFDNMQQNEKWGNLVAFSDLKLRSSDLGKDY